MSNILNDYKKFSLTLAFLVIVLGVVAVGSEQITPVARIAVSEDIKEERIEPFFRNPFVSVKLEAQAAYVLDTKTGHVLFAKNAEAQLPLASLTKLMTAVLAEEQLPKNQIVTITDDALRAEGDSGFSAGERWRISDLIDYTLLTSSNDGARALASVVRARDGYVEAMNNKTKELGLIQTYFTNASGLDESTKQSGSYGSARDMATFLSYILREHPTLLEETAKGQDVFYSLDGKQYIAENTNGTVHDVPGLIASKTGFTDLAGGNLAVAYDFPINRPVVIVVLGSSREGRLNDVAQLASASRIFIQEGGLER